MLTIRELQRRERLLSTSSRGERRRQGPQQRDARGSRAGARPALIGRTTCSHPARPRRPPRASHTRALGLTRNQRDLQRPGRERVH